MLRLPEANLIEQRRDNLGGNVVTNDGKSLSFYGLSLTHSLKHKGQSLGMTN